MWAGIAQLDDRDIVTQFPAWARVSIIYQSTKTLSKVIRVAET